MKKSKWFLQIYLTTLITMWIQDRLDQANIIDITNVWADASSWAIIFLVTFALLEWIAHVLSKRKAPALH
ncbi:hypothetical protein BK049_04590 [Bacillus xiamenensis]|uniref:Uncharacterized protein n=1 Tax=Bacillus xiamenensis TaxID=1178537 RepID=A0AAC9IEI3_9BACI|nr:MULTISPECIES: hypothetical protein [Bacillus]AOZ88040.1 hypothetical protein BK049_04590 [Bacillus xiamenensis]EKF36875.1 hypothetical protein BA1_03635 [Bacillus xiamenensis]MBG9912206.1 hypothetical protein [Bacillus xiamenensis]MCW1836556.1 hypothetical protein [Bacillus xiamenensis]MCY9574975.1 hypothetical protein [Bacillus xiamenensis]